MKTLLIYDLDGRIMQRITGCYIVPVGIPYIEIDEESYKDKIIKSVNVETKELVLEDIPKTQDQINQDQIKSLGEQLTEEKLKNIEKDKTIDALGKELAQIKLQLIQK
jgi:hypothetical protein